MCRGKPHLGIRMEGSVPFAEVEMRLNVWDNMSEQSDFWPGTLLDMNVMKK